MAPPLNRREILKVLAGMTAALLAPGALAADAPATQPVARDRYGDLLPQRKLGTKGPMVTMLGLGGAHIGMIEDDATAQKTIETAIAGGIRVFDNAAGYSRGLAEQRYGQFLTPKYRDVIFLYTKTQSANAQRARLDLDNSLSRLKTDYLDLWHMHSLHSPEDADQRLANGVLDVLLDAKKKGKVRHVGFSGHVIPDSHVHMLQRGAEKQNPFTAIQMPVNVADPSYHSFVLNVIPRAVEMGVGICAMKTLANGGFFGGADGTGPKLIPDRISVADALHFVWSLPVSFIVSGARSPEMIQEKIDLARSFAGMNEQRRGELIAKVADLAGPVVEPHKVPPGERPNRGNRGNRGGRAGAGTQPA